jgi:hypothetical protein
VHTEAKNISKEPKLCVRFIFISYLLSGRKIEEKRERNGSKGTIFSNSIVLSTYQAVYLMAGSRIQFCL